MRNIKCYQNNQFFFLFYKKFLKIFFKLIPLRHPLITSMYLVGFGICVE